MTSRPQTNHADGFGLRVLCIALITACAVLLYSTNGVRGTDQYWYLADVEQLANGSPPVTNLAYPGFILRNTSLEQSPNHFMHNGPMLHLTAFASQWGTPYKAWAAINFICHLLVAAAIFIALSIHTNKNNSYLLTSLYLISPIAIWQSVNMLQEQYYAGLVAICFIMFSYHNVAIARVLLVATLTIGIMSHPIFTVLALGYVVYLVAASIAEASYGDTALAALVATLFFSAKIATPVLFPSSFQSDMSAIIGSAIPGRTNMLWHYSNNIPTVDASLIFNKLIFALKNHLINVRYSALYFYTNLAFISCALLVLINPRRYARVLIPCCLALGSYAAIIVLMQIQPRYQQIVAPASFIVIGLLLFEWGSRFQIHIRIATLTLLIITAGISGFLGHTARQQSIAEKNAMLALATELSSIPSDAKVLILDSEHELKLTYALRPRKVLAMRTEFLSADSRNLVLSTFQPGYLISTRDVKSPLPIDSQHQVGIDNLGTLYQSKIQ